MSLNVDRMFELVRTELLAAVRGEDLCVIWCTAMSYRVVCRNERRLRRAGAPSTIMPTRRRGGPSFKCFRTPSAPMKVPLSRLSLPARANEN